ncbi:MAG: hypothetical protein ACJ8EY_11755, partial [Sphingomicrobium sp.]
LTWLYLSSYVLIFGAELNSELEHQTAADTTEGADKPLGARGAWAADHVADGQEPEPSQASGLGGNPGNATSRPAFFPTPASPATGDKDERPSEHTYLTSRATARVGKVMGMKKVGMVSSVLSTAGLALMRRKGREGVGATMLAAAAGIALLKRDD